MTPTPSNTNSDGFRVLQPSSSDGFRVLKPAPAPATDPVADPYGHIQSNLDQSANQPKIGNFLSDLGLGALKGAGSTINSAKNLGTGFLGQTAGRVANVITGHGFTPTQTNPEEQKMQAGVDKATTATNTAQKIGKTAEQVGEFFIPGGAEDKIAGTVEKAVGEAPKIAQTAAKLGTKVLGGAATTAGMTALQGGSGENVKHAGEAGGAISLASGGLGKLLKSVPETAWSSILKRTPAVASKNPDLPAQAAATGLTGASRASIAEKAKGVIQQLEVNLDDLLSKPENAAKKISTDKITPYLAHLKDAYSKIPGEENAYNTIDSMEQVLASKKNLSLTQANEMKQAIYKNIANSYGKGILDLPAKTDAQKAIARGLKTEIEKVIPEAKTITEKQAVYIQIKKALDKTIARTEGKGILGTGIGLYDLGAGGLAEMAGLASGHPLAGVGAIALKKSLESPAVLSSTSKLFKYFDTLSPTKKLLFYHGIQGLVSQGVRGDNPK